MGSQEAHLASTNATVRSHGTRLVDCLVRCVLSVLLVKLGWTVYSDKYSQVKSSEGGLDLESSVLGRVAPRLLWCHRNVQRTTGVGTSKLPMKQSLLLPTLCLFLNRAVVRSFRPVVLPERPSKRHKHWTCRSFPKLVFLSRFMATVHSDNSTRFATLLVYPHELAYDIVGSPFLRWTLRPGHESHRQSPLVGSCVVDCHSFVSFGDCSRHTVPHHRQSPTRPRWTKRWMCGLQSEGRLPSHSTNCKYPGRPLDQRARLNRMPSCFVLSLLPSNQDSSDHGVV